MLGLLLQCPFGFYSQHWNPPQECGPGQGGDKVLRSSLEGVDAGGGLTFFSVLGLPWISLYTFSHSHLLPSPCYQGGEERCHRDPLNPWGLFVQLGLPEAVSSFPAGAHHSPTAAPGSGKTIFTGLWTALGSGCELIWGINWFVYHPSTNIYQSSYNIEMHLHCLPVCGFKRLQILSE